MKEARNYIDTLRKSVRAWDYWINNGNSIISDVGVNNYLKVIEFDTNALSNLDAKEVEDWIMEHKDGIAFRIKRISDYGLLPLLQYLEDFKNVKSCLNNEVINEAINKYFLLIYGKANDLCRVMSLAEKKIPLKHPIVQKALNNPILLDIFYDSPDELEKYIKFCLATETPTERARRAKRLAVATKIRPECINTKLRNELKSIGIDVGEYKTWQGAANKA